MKHNKIYFSIFICLAIALLASACQAEANSQVMDEAPAVEPTATLVPSPTPVPAINILFLGNSLIGGNGGVEIYLPKLAAENGSLPAIEVGTSYFSHRTIYQLWKGSEDLRAKKDFNYVVVFETFQNIGINAGGTNNGFSSEVRTIDSQNKATGGETILLMGWGYGYGGQYRNVFTQDIANIHTEIAEDLGVKVAPVGLAFEAALNERPDYGLMEMDNIMPNYRGTYLATLVLYATIFEENPAGLTYQMGEMWGAVEAFATRVKDWHFSDDELSFLQRIAWETVLAYPQSGVTE